MAATLGIKECGFGIILFGGGQQPLKEDIMVLWFGSAATHMGDGLLSKKRKQRLVKQLERRKMRAVDGIGN
ncbi:hypothetical protein GBA52_024374 [Prunus armeniaca]|nr:hypothetical protein GBA52_024374 [Prunus armeniaca]